MLFWVDHYHLERRRGHALESTESLSLSQRSDVYKELESKKRRKGKGRMPKATPVGLISTAILTWKLFSVFSIQ